MDPYAAPVFGIGGLWAGQRRAWDGLPPPVPWWVQYRPLWATQIPAPAVIPGRRPAGAGSATPKDPGTCR